MGPGWIYSAISYTHPGAEIELRENRIEGRTAERCRICTQEEGLNRRIDREEGSSRRIDRDRGQNRGVEQLGSYRIP